jgi:hypothetical protein
MLIETVPVGAGKVDAKWNKTAIQPARRCLARLKAALKAPPHRRITLFQRLPTEAYRFR